MRLAAIALPLVFLCAATAWAKGDTTPTVSCDRIIIPGEPVSWRPKRVVLGVVAVPPAYIPQTVDSQSPRWPFWSKSGLVIRGNSPPVVVNVPARWRNRVAITWGNTPAVSTLRIASCGSGILSGWNPYAGGFLLRARTACVPLTFRVGSRSATVRFGVGKRCA
jgi:hypothetical protein